MSKNAVNTTVTCDLDWCAFFSVSDVGVFHWELCPRFLNMHVCIAGSAKNSYGVKGLTLSHMFSELLAIRCYHVLVLLHLLCLLPLAHIRQPSSSLHILNKLNADMSFYKSNGWTFSYWVILKLFVSPDIGYSWSPCALCFLYSFREYSLPWGNGTHTFSKNIIWPYSVILFLFFFWSKQLRFLSTQNKYYYSFMYYNYGLWIVKVSKLNKNNELSANCIFVLSVANELIL
jgi:hypothetical protein